MQRNLKGIYTIWYREILRFWSDRMRIVASLGQPLLFLFVFGSGLSPSMSGLAGGNMDFKLFLFPGIISMAVLFTAVSSAISIVWDREFGFLKEVLVAPISRSAVALGKVAGGSTVAVFQGLIILLLSPLIGVSLNVTQILQLVGLMLLTAAAMTSLGVLIASRVQSMEAFPVLMNFILMPMFFLSGSFFPLRDVPTWLEWLGRIDPLTYGVDPIRQVTLRGNVPQAVLESIRLHDISTDVLVLLIFWAVMMVPAVIAFRRME
ncbi:MAG: ABC transporter permease [Dehalococcoidia bacterium]|nr:ABC transporter permease [Dehalococcoidia bacterium]